MAGDVPKAFDTIARDYDTTREPLEASTLEAVGALLRTYGIRDLLEVGVGTGRIALPLTGLGFQIVGLDASKGMITFAHTKGLNRLVRGSAYHLPLGDGSVDATLMVHVLHLLDQPAVALREGTRVSRHGAWALVHPETPESDARAVRDEPWRVVFRMLAEDGYPVPERGGGPPAKERALLRSLPPDLLTVVSDRMVTETFSHRVEILARGASRHTMHIPKEALRRAVDRARAEVGDRTYSFRRVEALARWSTMPEAPDPAA